MRSGAVSRRPCWVKRRRATIRALLMAEKNSIHFIYYFASSCDGFIADPSGGVEWLNAFHGGVDYGANDLFKSFDGAVMGRKTYEQALTFGKWGFSAKMPCVVLSKTRASGPHVGFLAAGSRRAARVLPQERREECVDGWRRGCGEFLS